MGSNYVVTTGFSPGTTKILFELLSQRTTVRIGHMGVGLKKIKYREDGS